MTVPSTDQVLPPSLDTCDNTLPPWQAYIRTRPPDSAASSGTTPIVDDVKNCVKVSPSLERANPNPV